MREAIAASERETEERNERVRPRFTTRKLQLTSVFLQSTQEDAELRRALAESSKSAASPSHSRAASQEQAELSQAILESRRQALFESQARRSSSLHPSQPPPPTLDDSEWIIQARNEKGELWREGGAHGWLPPGAGRAGGEDSAEQEMLELAIRISLEEEEARQALEAEFAYVEDPPALPPRPKRYSISPATDSTSDSTDSTPPPPIPTRSLPPVPSSPSLRHTPSLSFVAPSRPKIFEHDENRGSPIEMPFLTPSTSFRTAREPSTSSSEEEDDEDYAGRRFLQGTFGVSSNGGYSDEQGTEESGPSFNSTSSGTSSEEAASFPPFISELAGRSLSLVSERTEPSPSTTSLASLEDEPTTSTSSFPSTNSYGFGSERLNIGPSAALRARLASERERGLADDAPTSLHSSTPSTRSIAPPGPTPNDFPPPANSEEAAILQQSPPPTSSALVDEPEETGETFGDGVRFGYPASCAQEHACAMDGLHSTAPFLEEVELSTAEGEKKGSFSVEARTWVALLRFLMWYVRLIFRCERNTRLIVGAGTAIRRFELRKTTSRRSKAGIATPRSRSNSAKTTRGSQSSASPSLSSPQTTLPSLKSSPCRLLPSSAKANPAPARQPSLTSQTTSSSPPVSPPSPSPSTLFATSQASPSPPNPPKTPHPPTTPSATSLNPSPPSQPSTKRPLSRGSTVVERTNGCWGSSGIG